MTIRLLRASLAAVASLLLLPHFASAAPCMIVTLTGTKGGPAAVNGLAGPGTLVRFGDDSNDCGAVRLQFDVGRGTSMRHSQLGLSAGDIDAIFITHVHSDHTDGFSDLMQLRWHYHSPGPKIELVCSNDKIAPPGHVISCRKLAQHVADSFIQSGEIAQRHNERKMTLPGGPSQLIDVRTFEPENEAQIVWRKGEVSVSAIRSTHMAGHASYRVDAPAGSVVISGDASNDTPAPPRPHSTSDQVERLAKAADVIVHSTTHPNMGPEKGGGMPAPIFYRQSIAPDIGAMAARAGAKHVMLTHLTPSLGETKRVDNWRIVGAPLKAEDFLEAVRSGGFKGNVIVGEDLVSLRLPSKK